MTIGFIETEGEEEACWKFQLLNLQGCLYLSVLKVPGKGVARYRGKNKFCCGIFQCPSSWSLIWLLMDTASRKQSPRMTQKAPFGAFFNCKLICGGNANPSKLQSQNSETNQSIAYTWALKMSDQGITVLDVSFSLLLPFEVSQHLQISEPTSKAQKKMK